MASSDRTPSAATPGIGYYHVILQSDRGCAELLEEIESEENLSSTRQEPASTPMAGFTPVELSGVSRFPPLSLIDKAASLTTIHLGLQASSDWKSSWRQIPVSKWLAEVVGPEDFERIWLPLLKSKLGENYRLTSASFIWATIARMYAARRTGLKREMFGYVEGGYERVLERFGRHLGARGIALCAAAGRGP